MKRIGIKRGIALAVFMMMGIVMQKENVKADTWGQWIYEGNEYEVILTGYTGQDVSVTIPSQINGKAVVALRGTFYQNKKIKTVFIPDSVHYIDSVWEGGWEDELNGYKYWDSCNGTFEGCSNLTTVKGGKQVNAYAEETFKRCSKLKSIHLYQCSNIPGKMFLGCSSLKSIQVPDTVKNISYWSFAECTSLKKVTGSKKVTQYGEGAFRNCKSLTSIHLGKTKTIPLFLFYKCSKLSSINIPTTVISIQYSAFAYSGLKSVKFPSSLKYVGGGREDETDREGAFEHCTKLLKVTGGKNVEVYGVCAFKDCKGLKSFSFGKITKIQRYVFAGCSSLWSVKLPSTVRIIGTGAFRDCKKLRKVSMPGKIHTMEHEAFLGCKVLKNLTIPYKVTTIYEDSVPEKRTIRVYKNSYAEKVFSDRLNVKKLSL